MRSISFELSESQKRALTDLLIIGMYADHTLTSAEDDYLQRLLDSFEFPSDYTRRVFVDAAFARIRGHTASSESIRAYVEELAQKFPCPEERREVYEAMDELLSSDGVMSEEEKRVLRVVRELFEASGQGEEAHASGLNGSWRRK
jgi:uncharacterized tellurite resistance protein B-like protein